MKKTLLAMTSALLLTGTMSFAASAQSGYYDDLYYHDDRRDTRYDDRDDDRDDHRDDDRYDERYYERYDRYSGRNARSSRDIDRDGIADRYDRRDSRNGQSWDRNRNGVNDRYERRNGYRDRDGDGIANRYDRDRDGDGIANRYDRNDRRTARQRYQAGRYLAPRGYRYVRYDIGSRLPASYYGSHYYVDYRPYGLSAPPRGYRWNRVGSDAYLVSVTNGLVREVIYSLFY